MATTIKETEAVPSAYPDLPDGLSNAALFVNSFAIWQRIESYCRVRWTARTVTWVVEGQGDWQPPLSPATVSIVEVWDADDGWVATSPGASPLGGYCFDGCGPYQVTAEVGGGDVPAAVSEAYRRLAEYLADEPDRAGVSSYSVNMGGAIEESYQRSPTWSARALELSGAADLLRPYKRRA
ncbi:hypothetical protein [Marinibacterium sp. SX1]|uniref:hypothetical protein n=1 Tax=Marinibacterium sp. SX1 TaxID=3388424 RepID=UPI003D17DD75